MTALTLGGLLVVLMTTPVPPLRSVDGMMFGYYNNAFSPDVLFYFNGWVHALPEIAAYAARGLPLAVQFAIYPALALALGLIMLREVQKLLAPWFGSVLAAVLSLVILAYFQVFIPVLTSLVWSVWTVVIAAFCHIVRRNIGGERYGWAPLGATALACMSNPLAVVFIPLLGGFAVTAADRVLRRQNLGLAILLIVWFAATIALKPADAHYLGDTPVRDAVRVIWIQVRHPNAAGLLIVAALGVLTWTSYAIRCAKDRPARIAIYALAYIGAASIGVYLFSGRAELQPVVPRRYTIVCFVTALIAALIYAGQRFDDRQRRGLTIALAAIVAAVAAFLATRVAVVPPTYRSFRFMQAADEFRRTCRTDSAITELRTRNVPVVLCAPVEVRPAGGAAIEDRDRYGNAFVAGPPALIWGTAETRPTRLLAPGR